MCVVTYIKGKPVLVDKWFPEDIVMTAKELGKDPTEEDVELIMRVIADRHDANIGINWGVIESAIDHVMGSA